ncbi:MAG: hypothetical protein ACK4Y5_16630 [Acetobacteraceae bacterium]
MNINTNHPAPLVAAEVDLRDFAFMPLDVLRLRDSELACVEDAEVFRCAVLSWCVSWHQVPAASLPDDDTLLARLLGFGRDVKGWKRVRAAGGMRGWVLCSDGRLYHVVVAEKARDAWSAKLAQRARTEAARKAREEARQRQSQPLSQTQPPSVTETVTESKGQGQGQGQGQGIKEEEKAPTTVAAAAAPPHSRPQRGTRLPAGWSPGPEQTAFAESLGIRNGAAAAELEKFRDYWAALPGQKGVKTDWTATWRNWLRRKAEDGKTGAAGSDIFAGAE